MSCVSTLAGRTFTLRQRAGLVTSVQGSWFLNKVSALRVGSSFLPGRHAGTKRELRRIASFANTDVLPTGSLKLPNKPEEEHIPVLLQEVLDCFKDIKLQRFVDGTLGAGGHSAAIAHEHQVGSPAGSLVISCHLCRNVWKESCDDAQ